MKKIILIFTLLLAILTGCTQPEDKPDKHLLVETIYDGLSLSELEEECDYHIIVNVLEKTLSNDEEYPKDSDNYIIYDYYKVEIVEIEKGELSNSIIYLRYNAQVYNTSDLVINETYHIYADLLAESKKIDRFKDDIVLFIDSPNAQCYTLAEHQEKLASQSNN